MNPTAQESACSDHNAFCAEASPLDGLDPEYLPFIRREKETGDRALDSLESRMLLEERSDRAAVQSTVALRAWRPDSGALAPVQHPELNHGEIGGPPHDSSQRIDFANDSALCDASNGRIA
jgi:hypothetical protein